MDTLHCPGMHIGILCPLDRPLMDPIHDPIAFHVRELAVRLQAAGHRVTPIGLAQIAPPDGRVEPGAIYARLARMLNSSDIEAVYDATDSAPASKTLAPIPSLRLASDSDVVTQAVAVERWPTQTTPQSNRLVWLGGLAPGCGLQAALAAARLVERPILLAGPVLDAPWFEAEVRPKMGPHAWHVGPLNRQDTADLLCCSALLIHTNTQHARGRPSVSMSVASGTPVVAVRTSDLTRWFTPDFGTLTDTAQPEMLAEAIRAISRHDRVRCMRAAHKLFALPDPCLTGAGLDATQSSGRASR